MPTRNHDSAGTVLATQRAKGRAIRSPLLGQPPDVERRGCGRKSVTPEVLASPDEAIPPNRGGL